MADRSARTSRSVTRITDVAKAAGVSPATVSRVLNGVGSVNPASAERVRQAATELDYRPSGLGRALRSQRTRVWAAIIADIENPFFTALVRSIENVAWAEGHRLVLCNSDEDVEKERAYIDTVIAEQVAGVVIAVASDTESRLDPLLERNVPVVAVDRRPPHHADEVDSVVVDNELGAWLATEHLIDGGAERIACITGPARASTASERLAGYEKSLRERGRALDASLVQRADFREDGGHAAARALLLGDAPPDALFVANNLMTLGAMRAVNEAGLRIPDDILVVGFDDAPWTRLLSPPLSVVSQPTHEIGREAARLLATPSGDRAARHLVLAPSLLVRGSSARS